MYTWLNLFVIVLLKKLFTGCVSAWRWSVVPAWLTSPSLPPPQDGRVVVKACEGLMLLVSLPEPAAAKCLTENTELVDLLTDRLSGFYKALPTSMDPLDIETVESVNWG